MVYLENISFIQWKPMYPRLFVKVDKYLVLEAKLIIWYFGKHGIFNLTIGSWKGKVVDIYVTEHQVNMY